MQLNQACVKFVSGYFSTNDRAEKTKSAYRSDLAQFNEFVGEGFFLKSVGGPLIERWCAHLRREGYSPTSIRRKMVVLKVFCSYWVRRGSLRESPFWRVKLSYGRVEQLPRALSAREMRKLLSQARKNDSSFNDVWDAALTSLRASSSEYRALRNLALVDLLFATGLRVGEVSALNVQDFFVREAVFRVKGKGGRDRLAVVVDEETLRIQRKYLEARARIETRSPSLFLNSSGMRLTTQGIANVIKQLREGAGIERHVTPHMLRHTVATLLLSNGVDIRIVQEFLGHASIATTQRYTHVTKEHLRGVLRKRHPSLGMYART
ncbi:MAG: tyrosine-type recombinase/integrase [Acidobacteriota bacterium]|nr:tyrosine-type recombinase/integrase [Acidobacteriota bacterium]